MYYVASFGVGAAIVALVILGGIANKLRREFAQLQPSDQRHAPLFYGATLLMGLVAAIPPMFVGGLVTLGIGALLRLLRR